RGAPGAAGLLARPGRATLPASASLTSVRRCAGVSTPTPHHHSAARLAATLAALGIGRTSAGWERGHTLPAGRGSSCPLSGGVAAVDRCRVGGAPAHPLRSQAILGAQSDSRERPDTVRGRHRVSRAATQLSARRGVADRFRLCRRCPADLAPVHGARYGHVVCDADRRGFTALVDRSVVWLREPAALPVPADALVFSHVYLGTLSLAGVTP